jgi:hypothetical protein
MRYLVDNNSRELRKQGESIIEMLDSAFKGKDTLSEELNSESFKEIEVMDIDTARSELYESKNDPSNTNFSLEQILGFGSKPIPYCKFKSMIK